MQISDQSRPDLDKHRVLRGTRERLDFQVLLDLCEEFDPPATAIKLGYLQGWQVQAVGEKKYSSPVSGSS